MLEAYYYEFDPVKRKEILDNDPPEPDEEPYLEQIRNLFSIRYTINRDGSYKDTFIGALISFQFIADRDRQIGKHQRAREVKKGMHILCLDRGNEFDPQILYMEMYHLVYLYICSCMEDHQYGSVFLGIGRMKETKITGKIRHEMTEIWDLISDYTDGNEGYRILTTAIRNIVTEKIKPPEDPEEEEKKSSQSVPRKFDE